MCSLGRWVKQKDGWGTDCFWGRCKTTASLLAVTRVRLSWTCTLFISWLELHGQTRDTVLPLDIHWHAFLFGSHSTQYFLFILGLKHNMWLHRGSYDHHKVGCGRSVVTDPPHQPLFIFFLKLVPGVQLKTVTSTSCYGHWLQARGFASPLWMNRSQPQTELSRRSILEGGTLRAAPSGRQTAHMNDQCFSFVSRVMAKS